MAVKTKVKVDLDRLRDALNTEHARDALTSTGQEAVHILVNDYVKKGVSPVNGEQRFTGYSSQRGRGENGYPDKYVRKEYGKTKRPVNLTLTGEFLSRLTSWYDTAEKVVFIGFKNITERDRILFDVHNNGARSDIPRRRFLPIDGEGFKKAFTMRIVKALYPRIKRAIARSK
jgi:hypothetical protein